MAMIIVYKFLSVRISDKYEKVSADGDSRNIMRRFNTFFLLAGCAQLLRTVMPPKKQQLRSVFYSLELESQQPSVGYIVILK